MASVVEFAFDLRKEAEFIASAINVPVAKVIAAAELLEEGNTIPFLARYRKEATGGLDESQLSAIEDAIEAAKELAQRKSFILKTINDAGALDDDLRKKIVSCRDKKLLEDLYLPFKPKRRTRASIARERGLAPLAELLLRQRNTDSPSNMLRPFIDAEKEVPDASAALAGAVDILAEQWSVEPSVRAVARKAIERGELVSQLKRGAKDEEGKFEMYHDFREPISRVPSHRLLAMLRGEADKKLKLKIEFDEEGVVRQITNRLVTNPDFHFHGELSQAASECCHRLVFPSLQTSLLSEKKEAADAEAIEVFSQNLRELLLAPPAGQRVVMGIDPGYRTGCKVAVVDATGKFLEFAAIYPTPPRNQTEQAAKIVLDLIERHRVELIGIGTGTASRETDAFVTKLLREHSLDVTKISVSESGASIYSASDVARREFPDLDLTIRGAISIARRLQDPLAELVKLDPKSIGVGQYQHDVNQSNLRKALERQVQSCVNLVGVDVNTASEQLLSYVSGIGPKLAQSILSSRNERGAFNSREQLKSVPRLGGKAFQQSAGFLRVRGGPQPLDNSAVHPERYDLVGRMAASLNASPEELVGNRELATKLNSQSFVTDDVGLPTIKDILAELEKPGRDPRRQFKAAQFAEGVEEISDLQRGMTLEGVVTNVTRFGAFVDVGVHQDGLIHISELDNRYVNDPTEVVSVGDIVKVLVLDVDVNRRRIALSRKQALG